MKTIQLQRTGVVTLSAALAILTIHLVEKGFGFKLNGETAEVVGAITCIYHALLGWLGVSDVQTPVGGK